MSNLMQKAIRKYFKDVNLNHCLAGSDSVARAIMRTCRIEHAHTCEVKDIIDTRADLSRTTFSATIEGPQLNFDVYQVIVHNYDIIADLQALVVTH